ncbi:hypothetical protein CPB84DRAFT_1847434 [Gymnopilus junonius]|uniref:Uncharacterized protein n=1 Tax=Gymnopilus junonius TaxID=109634 RepID=A0A9P5NMN1_GYMJU|nr:hypothetical protein CPB84DRAFT_1847434 [Gymnopilus junonius]
MEPQHGQQPQADDIGTNTPPPERAPGPNNEEDGGSEGITESEADGSNESNEDGAHHAASKLGIMKGSSG